MQAFVGRELNIHINCREKHPLSAFAFQVNFHARTTLVPQRDVAEGVEIKVGVELAIQSSQNVLVKRSRDTLRIVVGRNEDPWAFGEVRAEQQRIAGAQRSPNATQYTNGFVQFEIADTGPYVQHQLATGDAAERLDAAGVVGDDRIHAELWETLGELGHGFPQSAARDVDGVKQRSRLALHQFFDQDACLAGGAGA